MEPTWLYRSIGTYSSIEVHDRRNEYLCLFGGMAIKARLLNARPTTATTGSCKFNVNDKWSSGCIMSGRWWCQFNEMLFQRYFITNFGPCYISDHRSPIDRTEQATHAIAVALQKSIGTGFLYLYVDGHHGASMCSMCYVRRRGQWFPNFMNWAQLQLHAPYYYSVLIRRSALRLIIVQRMDLELFGHLKSQDKEFNLVLPCRPATTE